MSQAITISAYTPSDFDNIRQSMATGQAPVLNSIDDVTLWESFSGLEFVINKVLQEQHTELIAEIFFPHDFLGDEAAGGHLNVSMDENDFKAMLDAVEKSLYYLSPEKINAITALLQNITPAQVTAAYDAEELNANNIAPAIWHEDNNPDLAFNQAQLVEDFTLVKALFEKAQREGSYIISHWV